MKRTQRIEWALLKGLSAHSRPDGLSESIGGLANRVRRFVSDADNSDVVDGVLRLKQSGNLKVTKWSGTSWVEWDPDIYSQGTFFYQGDFRISKTSRTVERFEDLDEA